MFRCFIFAQHQQQQKIKIADLAITPFCITCIFYAFFAIFSETFLGHGCNQQTFSKIQMNTQLLENCSMREKQNYGKKCIERDSDGIFVPQM